MNSDDTDTTSSTESYSLLLTWRAKVLDLTKKKKKSRTQKPDFTIYHLG